MRSKTSALGVKSLKQDIKSGIVIFLTIASLGVITVFAANWYDSILVTSGETLTATKWNTLAKATVPTGFIGAFNLATCPDGWLPADGTTGTPDLRGAFLRGMNGNLNSRDVVRALGDYQADDFKSHNHLANKYAYDAGTGLAQGGGASLGTASSSSPSAGGIETRPKNVAVLYCVKL